MKPTVVVVAYAINPYKGSEDGTGWNWVKQASVNNHIIAITRKNNREAIERFQKEERGISAEFLYYDLPTWARFWKRGSTGALPYYLLWQLFIPLFIKKKIAHYDIIHQLNFHNDWTPTFSWLLKKPVIWGPIGHHTKIPKQFISPFYKKKEYWKDRFTWAIKNYFWKIDPFLKISRAKAKQILCINSESVVNKNSAFDIVPAVACKPLSNEHVKSENFIALSVGRFVPLKGMDIAIRSFARFANQLSKEEQKEIGLKVVGKGPYKKELKELIEQEKASEYIEIIEWMPRDKLMELFQVCSLYLFPSHEGAGMVVMEALAAGLPVICFDNDGPGEFINDSCGKKVPYGEFEKCHNEFSQHLLDLFRDREALSAMSEAAKKHHRENHQWEHRGQSIDSIYRKTLNNEKARERTLFPLPQ